MGLLQVYTLFSKVFTNCNNLPLNTLRLVELRIPRPSLFHSVIADEDMAFIKLLILTLTQEIFFAFLEACLLIVPGIISLKYVVDILFNSL